MMSLLGLAEFLIYLTILWLRSLKLIFIPVNLLVSVEVFGGGQSSIEINK